MMARKRTSLRGHQGRRALSKAQLLPLFLFQRAKTETAHQHLQSHAALGMNSTDYTCHSHLGWICADKCTCCFWVHWVRLLVYLYVHVRTPTAHLQGRCSSEYLTVELWLHLWHTGTHFARWHLQSFNRGVCSFQPKVSLEPDYLCAGSAQLWRDEAKVRLHSRHYASLACVLSFLSYCQ